MRVLIVGLVVATGCGGNWSSDDLVFANALPRRDDLKARIPVSATTQPLWGVATRRDGLMVGDPSGVWIQTRKATVEFNALLDSVLGLVEQVRTIAPTSRTTTTRTWGPFDDANNPGRQVQVSITRVDDTTFTWSIQSRPSTGAFVEILSGTFSATDTVRRGVGAIVVHVKDFRDVVKVDDNFKQLDEITMGYVTDTFPRRVEMLFSFKAGSTSGLSGLGYTSRVQQDGSGAMRFVYTGPGPEVQELEINSAWKTTGEGKGVGVVRKGTYTGATVTECWGKSFTVVHYAEGWAGGVTNGNSSDCSVIDGL